MTAVSLCTARPKSGKLAHKFAGKKERLNEGLAEKYKKLLADLSDTDSDDSDAGDIALL